MRRPAAWLLGCAAAAGLPAAAAPVSAQAPACYDHPLAAAGAAYHAISRRDGGGLAALAGSGPGVRLSPSAFADPGTDVVLSPAEVAGLWADETVRTWGYAEGTGEAIILTGEDYIARYVAAFFTDHGFDELAIEPAGAAPQSGGTVNNAARVYPEADIVVFRRASPGGPGQDWIGLRMAFAEDEEGCSRLEGVISDRWGP